ncbi:MAG: HDOD domain-containing protein [Deltaproteobacteria bacterium]|nr:HDOD domain-containing protein [Deltaproteobacteria bacterium]
MKLRILFVDDEPHVLQGLQRMLRGMRDVWEIATAASGPEALDLLSRKPVDVVVTDMRMPGMDGNQLLQEIKNRYPEIVRIILSGQSDREMVLKSVRPAHQYLSKPCRDEILKSTIERSCGLRDLLADNSLKRLISRLDSLPSQPALYLEILRELESPYSSMHRIGEIISQDLGMTAKILQLVNSAFFGFRRHISSPAEAAELLGLETIKALVLSVKIFSQLDKAGMKVFAVDRIWAHSLATGVFAKTIATAEKQERTVIDDAFMAGLLHDAGKLILAANLPQQYKEALVAARNKGSSDLEEEQRAFRVTHAEVGAYLLALWGLPFPIVEAIAFHHSPSQCPHQELGILTAVHVGSALELLLHHEKDADSQLDRKYLAELEILHKLPEWQALYRQTLEEGPDHDA